MKFSIVAKLLIFLAISSTWTASAGDSKPNPDFIYFSAGDTPDNWGWVLVDSVNWWFPIEGNTGKSKGSKVIMSETAHKSEGDAVKMKWKRKDIWGEVKITGRKVDLSKYENSAELLVVLRVDRKPKKQVKVSMTCGDDCKAEIMIEDLLRNAPKNEWYALPIPLNCFSKKGANLANIETPFAIGTQGQLELSIANIYVVPMAEGDQGCAKVTEEM